MIVNSRQNNKNNSLITHTSETNAPKVCTVTISAHKWIAQEWCISNDLPLFQTEWPWMHDSRWQ